MPRRSAAVRALLAASTAGLMLLTALAIAGGGASLWAVWALLAAITVLTVLVDRVA
ncbi:hypothetical protein [Allostreptomyces psammosilenae]|uniref:Uncharacterized protein n=1 Tax=Allostreptomyces psammosilenae TaxID=1892865 RepID=A0A853A439_9ACTN|nr:hypothetical protein [Allostreptomyces psammosilenae]NYI08230.1 hypothetical protein [Allostreptomyces psammosilenae]